MIRLSKLGPVVIAVRLAVLAVPAAAHDLPGADSADPTASGSNVTTGRGPSESTPPAGSRYRWHGSTLTFDQSVTTQTVHVGGDYQTYNPTYEWWVALKPRYFLHETRTDAISVNAWLNLYLELTNSDTTTRVREPVFGPTFLWASYAHTFYERAGNRTTVTIGPRATIPTEKAARNVGRIVDLGGLGSVSQAFALWGRQARVGVSGVYFHSFTRATSGTNSDIQQLRQDVLGRTFLSDQLTGGMLVQDALNVALTGDLRLSRRLELSLSYVFLNAWTDAPPPTCVAAFPACVSLPVDDPVTFRAATWALASINYDLLDAVTLEAGYYNLADQLGPDGTRRNPLWSPGARFFLAVVGQLDVLYGRLARKTSNQ